MKSNNNKNNNNNNIIFNNNSCNHNYLIKLYNSVFNNKYLKKIIFNHLHIFNILYPVNIEFKSAKEFQDFKFKDYLYRITLKYKLNQDLNELPSNINHITIGEENEIIQLSSHIESVSFKRPVDLNYFIDNNQPLLSKIDTLSVVYCLIEGKPILIPQSVTDLEFDLMGKTLPKNVLPTGLRKLSIERFGLFEDECLPIESLRDISIKFSNPLIINQFSRSSKIASSLVKLNISNISADIDNNIHLPDTLQEITIECKSFNSRLPKNLKSLILQFSKYDYPIQFPSSLEHLSIFSQQSHVFRNQQLFENSQAVPPNLKSLAFQCSSIIDNNGKSILPNKLEKLIIREVSFNQILKPNQLPSSLTYLDSTSLFDQVIDDDVLPANLKTLILGYGYSQVINPLAIPQQLKLLEINNYHYSHPINLKPSTHPNTAVSTLKDIKLYYQATSSDYNQIRVLRLPQFFKSSLSTLQLQNKSNLEYLHLGNEFNYPIELSDLPIQNNIKTLELGRFFKQIINLEYFQNLETLIINQSTPTIITTTTTTTIYDQQQQNIHYNNYRLKNIIVSSNHSQFLKQLDNNFYQFLKNSTNIIIN